MKSKVAQNKASLKHNNNLRIKAINKLGGICSKGCGDNRIDKLMVMAIGIAKEWGQQLFYRRVIEAINPNEIARLLCKDCYGNERNNQSLVRRFRVSKPIKENQGEYHWIGGQRVLKRKGYDDTPEHLIDKL